MRFQKQFSCFSDGGRFYSSLVKIAMSRAILRFTSEPHCVFERALVSKPHQFIVVGELVVQKIVSDQGLQTRRLGVFSFRLAADYSTSSNVQISTTATTTISDCGFSSARDFVAFSARRDQHRFHHSARRSWQCQRGRLLLAGMLCRRLP
jgi:hypothetical protein